MADTLTVNYGWTKPDPGGDSNTWGVTLNATTDQIDNQVAVNAKGMMPIGSGSLWFTNTPPANWLICNGQSLSTTGTYAALFAVIGTTFNQSGDAAGTFRLPNLQSIFPLGVGGANPLGQTGGNFNNTIAVANLPVHNHTATDGGHQHGITWHQIPHGHTLTDPGHVHGTNLASMGAGGWYYASSGPQSVLFVNTASATTGISLGSNNASITIQPQTGNLQPNYSEIASATVTISNTGSGTPLSVVPPYLAINFIIKFA